MDDRFEINRTGVVVAFDAETGHVLLVNEIYEEVIDGGGAQSKPPDDKDRDELRKLAASSFASRKVDVIAVAQRDLRLAGNAPPSEWFVDRTSRTLSRRPRPDLFAARSR